MIQTYEIRATLNQLDCSAGDLELVIDIPSNTRPGVQITAVKTDDSVNVGSVKLTDGTTLYLLENQNDAVTLFCDGLAWSLVSLSTSTPAVGADGVALAVEGGIAEAVEQAATAEVAIRAGGGVVLTEPVFAIVRDVFGNVSLKLTPGGPDDRNHVMLSGSEATDESVNIEVAISLGGDDNVTVFITPRGTGDVVANVAGGQLIEGTTPVAISTETEIGVATGSVEAIAPTVAEFNALAAVVGQIRSAILAARVGIPA